MDYIKVTAKNEKKKFQTLIQPIRIYCQDRILEFVKEKYVIFIMKSGKKNEVMEGIELSYQERIRTLREMIDRLHDKQAKRKGKK